MIVQEEVNNARLASGEGDHPPAGRAAAWQPFRAKAGETPQDTPQGLDLVIRGTLGSFLLILAGCRAGYEALPIIPYPRL